MQDGKDIALSKLLSKILRHKANEEHLQIDEAGYIKVADLLNHQFFRQKYTVDDIKRVVLTNDKQRFSLKTDSQGFLEICANQGHSIAGVDKLDLLPITEPQSFDVIHGTYFKNWNKIREEGLSRMNRNHIHFAKGSPTDSSVISGIRKNCDIFIYINLPLALLDGLKFFLSPNEVVLSPGDESGIISPKYFLKVCNRRGDKLY